jgi:ribosome biogenesis GTPase
LQFPTLVPYGWNGRWAALFSSLDAPAIDRARAGPTPGRVVRHDGTGVLVALPDGLRSVPWRRSIDPLPAVGDWVVVADGAAAAVLDRTSLLTRRAAGADAPQPLAANVDLVLVACGLDRPVKAGRINRTVTLAWDAGAVPLVVLTKADLSPDAAAGGDAVRAAHPGVDVVVTSAASGDGIDELRSAVHDRTVVLIGESGAGKSSLTNALVADEVAATGHVRGGDAKGRHTTTARQAHLVPGGGLLIDTPGLRQVGLWADAEAVTATFADLDELAAGCRFNDCRHANEPGCAVLAAVHAGTLVAERLDAWRALEREAAALARRADRHQQKQWGRQFARLAKDAQRRKGR